MRRSNGSEDSSVESEDPPQPGVGSLLLKGFKLMVLAVVAGLILPFYLLGRLSLPRPPQVPRAQQFIRYLKGAWSVEPERPILTTEARIWITLSILQKASWVPLKGLAWFLDEMIYGHRFDEVEINRPIFVVSAGRSGSTQISRYIEQDPEVSAPNLLQCLFPYLFLWKLAGATLGRWFTPEQIRHKLESMMPPETIERHEFDPFSSDTFDGAFLGAHLNHLALYFGPEFSKREFNMARLPDDDRDHLEQDFIGLVDRLFRKHLVFTGEKEASRSVRLFLKGHFLFAAEVLSERYPDADFITVIREPAGRIRSAVNYLRVNPSDPAIGPPPWSWLSASILSSESDYCDEEMRWFSEKEGPRRCVIRFHEFVDDLPSTMARLYQACFQADELPAHVPSGHPPRNRTEYSVDKTLHELGLDEEEINRRNAGYVEWCRAANGT